eukprot:gene24177-32602_t
MSTKNFSIVDERGNINTSLLEKELVSSLAFDIKYKQTDNMKKRACKVATDYNEFKNMGWKKTPTASEGSSNSVNSAKILKQEKDKKELVALNDTAAKNMPTTVFKAINKVSSLDGTQNLKPKSFLQIEKALSCYSSSGEKLIYLLRVGIDRMNMLHRAGSAPDIECLEQLLHVLVDQQDYFFEGSDSSAATEPEGTSNAIPLHASLVLWLRFVCTSQHFELMIRFTSEDFRNAISSLLCRLQSERAFHTEEDEYLIRRFDLLSST